MSKAPVQATIEALRELLRQAREADARTLRDPIIDKALRRLDALAKRVDPSKFGAMGGRKTAERGPDYFRELAARRKTHAGGRPKKNPE